MKKRLIAHIGTHKTGSTSIQKALYESRAQLRAAGILFPSTDRGPRPSKHHSVNTAAKGRDAALADAEYKALMDEFNASGCSTMIVSAEGLSAPNPAVPEFFKRFADDFDIEVICYLRRQDLFVESLYNQMLRDPEAGEQRTIGQFWRDERISARLNYHQTLINWRNIPAKVRALDFAREVKQHGLLNSFLQAAQLQGVGVLPEKMANKSPDMNLVLLLRDLHVAGIGHNHKRLIRAAKSLEEEAGYKLIKHTLGSVDRALLLQQFQGINADLRNDFGIDFSTDMPAEPETALERPQPGYVLKLLAAMAVRRDKRDDDDMDAEAVLDPAQQAAAEAEKQRMKEIRLQRRADKTERRTEKNGQRSEKAERKAARLNGHGKAADTAQAG